LSFLIQRLVIDWRYYKIVGGKVAKMAGVEPAILSLDSGKFF